jgi:hypothetical protein
MLCILGSVKVLVSKDDLQDYRGAGVKYDSDCYWVYKCKRSVSGTYDYLASHDPSKQLDYVLYPGWHYACSESRYTDSKISFEWLKHVFDP